MRVVEHPFLYSYTVNFEAKHNGPDGAVLSRLRPPIKPAPGCTQTSESQKDDFHQFARSILNVCGPERSEDVFKSVGPAAPELRVLRF